MAGGPALFGYCLDIFLYGILTLQTYLYYLAFPNDRRQTKIAVYFVYVVGTLQTVFALRDFYVLFCTSDFDRLIEPGNFDAHRFGFTWFTIPVGGVLVATVVQLFYAHRIYQISQTKIATAIVSLLAFIQCVSGITSAVLSFRPGEPQGGSLVEYTAAVLGGTVAAVCDVIITVYMSYCLSKELRDSMSKSTHVLVIKITRLLFETGVITAGVAVAYAILTLFTPIYPCWFMAPGLCIGKLYANSMLVLLNNRFIILAGRNSPHPDFDISSDRRFDVADSNMGPVLSRGTNSAYNFSRGDVVHTS